MKDQAINLAEKLSGFEDIWSPRIVAQMNDYHVKVARLKGEFVWHKHSDTDEMFLVVAGEMRIDFLNGSVALKAGELFVVTKGREHRPVAETECRVLLIEPAGTRNTGDAGGDLTTENPEWI